MLCINTIFGFMKSLAVIVKLYSIMFVTVFGGYIHAIIVIIRYSFSVLTVILMWTVMLVIFFSR